MEFNNSSYFIFDKELKSSSGKKVQIYELKSDIEDADILEQWASSLKDYYIEDSLIYKLREGYNKTRQEYLEEMIFPNYDDKLGAATMSGEFGEILVHDFIKFKLDYYITKLRYLEKTNPNMPVSGCDVIGYYIESKDPSSPSEKDKLFVGEVKTRSSVKGNKMTSLKNPLSNAIKVSMKDREKISESLNAEKRRLIMRNKKDEANIVNRFQNNTDNPYTTEFSAIALFDKKVYSEELILNTINSIEIDKDTINILIIYSKELLKFIRKLYGRAAKC